MTKAARCGRFSTKSAPGVRPAGGSVAPEGGGQTVPTLGGGNGLGQDGTAVAKAGSRQ
jgi:hypothetical protein